MFYSQILLRKSGPLNGTWLAAHWGDKKLGRDKIFAADIAASVDALQDPAAPLALRVSGHLLLGVVRIYSRKVRYLERDCHEALLKFRTAFRAEGGGPTGGAAGQGTRRSRRRRAAAAVADPDAPEETAGAGEDGDGDGGRLGEYDRDAPDLLGLSAVEPVLLLDPDEGEVAGDHWLRQQEGAPGGLTPKDDRRAVPGSEEEEEEEEEGWTAFEPCADLGAEEEEEEEKEIPVFRLDADVGEEEEGGEDMQAFQPDAALDEEEGQDVQESQLEEGKGDGATADGVAVERALEVSAGCWAGLCFQWMAAVLSRQCDGRPRVHDSLENSAFLPQSGVQNTGRQVS